MAHIGEVGAARMVLKIAEDERTRALMSRYVDKEKIRSEIAGARNPLFIPGPSPLLVDHTRSKNP
jgi:hypothetical protein